MRITPLKASSINADVDYDVARSGMMTGLLKAVRNLVDAKPGTNENGIPKGSTEQTLDVYIIDRDLYDQIANVLQDGEGPYFEMLNRIWKGEDPERVKADYTHVDKPQSEADVNKWVDDVNDKRSKRQETPGLGSASQEDNITGGEDDENLHAKLPIEGEVYADVPEATVDPVTKEFKLKPEIIRAMVGGFEGKITYEQFSQGMEEQRNKRELNQELFKVLDMIREAHPETWSQFIETTVDEYNAQIVTPEQTENGQKEPGSASQPDTSVDTSGTNVEGKSAEDKFHMKENLEIAAQHTDLSKEPPLPSENKSTPDGAKPSETEVKPKVTPPKKSAAKKVTEPKESKK